MKSIFLENKTLPLHPVNFKIIMHKIKKGDKTINAIEINKSNNLF